MDANTKTKRLRIYASSTDKIGSQPMYESIVFTANKNNLAGATVLRGVMGYGASSVVHSSKFWELTEKLPIVIEIIDEEEKINSFFDLIKPQLDKLTKGCLVTIEDVKVALFKVGGKK